MANKPVLNKNISLIGYLFVLVGMSMMVNQIFLRTKSNYKTDIEVNRNHLEYHNYNFIDNNTLKEVETMEYFVYLKIPKINLEKELVDKSSALNNVDVNIQIIKESDMPDIINGNLILAAHSGSSNVSYFKDLDELDLNDIVYVKYSGKLYEYQVSNYYIVEKIGVVNIIRNEEKNTLTLITCVENTNKQLVVICELKEITNLN